MDIGRKVLLITDNEDVINAFMYCGAEYFDVSVKDNISNDIHVDSYDAVALVESRSCQEDLSKLLEIVPIGKIYTLCRSLDCPAKSMAENRCFDIANDGISEIVKLIRNDH